MIFLFHSVEVPLFLMTVPVHKFTVPVLKDSGVSGLVVQKPLMSTEHTQLLAGKPGMFVCVQMFVQDVFVYVCVCAGLQICVM